MNFAESQQYLFSLGNEVAAMKLGLENIRTLLTALGEPQTKYLKVHVAGTNGKGSVCAFLDSICRQANIKTGLYTSPHLISITERVRIGGVDISEEEFARIATHVRETAERLLADGKLEYRPTFFEQMTAIALVAFSEAKVELAILETGLGGRLDATTAANAEIAAITRIDLDHQEYLGNTIEEIAAEKAAIIHSGSRAAILEQTPAVMRILRKRCKEVSVKPRTTAEFLGQGFGLPKLGLLGDHQVENAEAAILVTEILRENFNISDESLVAGLENARHPGRLEYQGRYLFDGAHNVGGAKALVKFVTANEERPITMIFGAMSDKNVAEILAELSPLADKIVLTEPSNSRSLTYDELLENLPTGFSRERTFVSDSVEHAIEIAETITPDDGIMLVTGSLYLVGEVKSILKSQI
ncbi:MAG TPA: folylpolyglutamate synthase/dihydrofolate synthase family protein [Pyrinomonadaceae bacterium]|nr:folylpolyglutamate synthase/dihydrofolate synthase family protein [Pyrinomonadaceae bacterium]